MSAAGFLRARRYVAIITDGNGRWAAKRNLPVVEGHRAGADVVKARLRDAVDLGVEELTVFSFSTENWSRSDEEVAGLMNMFAERIAGETPELNDEGVRMRFIGRRTGVGAADRADGVGRVAHARQSPHHPVRRLQLRRAGGDRRRGPNSLTARPKRSSAPTCTRPRCTTRT